MQHLVLMALLVITPSQATVLLSMDEAIALVFGECQVQSRTVYLTYEQREAAEARAKVSIASSLVRQHVGLCDGEVMGTAYFDTHPVRELPATLMVVVANDGSIARVELLSFEGPDENKPGPGFYELIRGLRLDRDLAIKRSAIRPVSGATLSSIATVEAARRILALHEVIQAGDEP